ncbi:MAG: NAD+ synthase [Candidatus Kryptoniota bacterium]
METQTKELAINPGLVKKFLIEFIREETVKAGFKKLVVGISGGVDSALAAALAAEALGEKNVIGIILPYKETNPESISDANLFASKFRIRYETVDITSAAEPLIFLDPSMNKVRRGNILSRLRMIVLYDRSAKENALVLGTSNKTELLLGYGTLFGDMAHAINPLGDLYKTQVWQLAEFVGIPEKIVKKKPSADLWLGQTDEDELGHSYAEIDAALYLLVDQRMTPEEVIAAGHSTRLVNDLVKMIVRSQFKRRPPLIAKISPRTINIDFRYLRDWGV